MSESMEPEVSGPNKDARMWAMICHLSAFVGLIGVPFGNILGPLVVWMIKKEESPFVDENGKESLNFQISMTIYGIVSALLIFVVIGFLLLVIVALTTIVLTIIAGLKANDGESYRYPLTIRFIK